jgi:hypothetical protein
MRTGDEECVLLSLLFNRQIQKTCNKYDAEFRNPSLPLS